MNTKDLQPKEPARLETPRNDIGGIICPTRPRGTPFFPGWGPKLL